MKKPSMTSRPLAAILAAALITSVLVFAPFAHGQQVFSTPESAADAFVDAIARSDDEKLRSVLGSDFRRFMPAGSVADEDKLRFLSAWANSNKVVSEGPGKAALEVGTNGWTLPIPIVNTSAGWRFDPKGADAEMRKRRIGRNELAAIQVVLAYTDAQEEFYAMDPDGLGVKHFAMRALSTPGRRDGLYWGTLPGERESPLGVDFADAKRGHPYHGYLYRVLKAQGSDAPGGAKSYVRDGRMTEGYALIAWPERWNDTGVMTFIVNRDGVVYERNLGPDTDALARRIDTYNPGPGWTKVQLPQ